MFNKTDENSYGSNDQDTVHLIPTNNSLGASFLFKEIHMKRWFLGLILVLFFALATAVFAFGPECGMGGPPMGGDQVLRDHAVQAFMAQAPSAGDQERFRVDQRHTLLKELALSKTLSSQKSKRKN